MSKYVSKIELSPDKRRCHRYQVECRGAELSCLRRSTQGKHGESPEGNLRLPEIIVYDHIGFKGASTRTNLSFHYLGDFWNDRISCVIVVSGIWRFYRDEYYKGDYWDLGPGFYESFFTEAGPDDVVSSFQAIALT